jgi:hypothetical protein
VKPLDLTGKRFGRLTAGKRFVKGRRYRSYYECKCDCGRYVTVLTVNLKHKTKPTQSCGCIKGEKQKKMALNLTGERFGRLVPVSRVPGVPRQWNCKCDCGAIVKVRTGNLRSGITRSCGCMQPEMQRDAWIKRLGRVPSATEKAAFFQKKYIDDLADSYIRRRIWASMGVCGEQFPIPQSLIEAKRGHMRLNRLLKEARHGKQG